MRYLSSNKRKYSTVGFFFPFLSLFFSLFIFSAKVVGQEATIDEDYQHIKTYPYSDPNPIPSLGINDKVGAYYPYFIFDGYADTAIDKDWKVVTLENDFIKVTVLPEVGGKVMGAIEKSTGKEFIYLNDVMKFRAIGIRGPWTSGGIEHNFGLDLGHAPWTASDVDYVLRTNSDGSVSCVVGGLDLASRSEWRVDIRLPKDKAYFETRSMWYNPTPLNDAYLSWEIAAYKGTDDLQFYFPGTYYIGHDGDVWSWPHSEQGHNLSLYKENDFGTSKSYHVAGVYPNWFGGYFHDSDFGSGHWSSYDDAPGKKLWVWSLARDGAIWEDLLTDTHGQYIEAQSGVKLNQAHPWSGFNTPYNQLFMRPFYTETKSDFWFPVKETGGMVDANPYGTLNLQSSDGEIHISFCPNIAIRDTLVVTSGGKAILSEFLELSPMQVYHKTIALSSGGDKVLRVCIGQDLLKYTSDLEEVEIDRPTITPSGQDFTSAEHLYRQAEDMYSMRNYHDAFKTYRACIEKEPTHSRALSKMAELFYRQGQYQKGLEYAQKVLENNTYDPEGNFIYGVLHKALGNVTKAKEAFSVAVRSMEYRSASYVQLSGLFLASDDNALAQKYAKKALDYNRYNIAAYEFLATAFRKTKNIDEANMAINTLLDIDPLNHYAHFEQYLLDPSETTLSVFNNAIRNELPFETYIELALSYANQGRTWEAIKVLEQSPDYPIVSYWLAYLTRESAPEKSEGYLDKAIALSPSFVFPFRLETISVLAWAQSQRVSWKTNYYLGLIYWKALRKKEAIELLETCGDAPTFSIFYTTRGILLQSEKSTIERAGRDFEKALSMDSSEWRTWYYLCTHYRKKGNVKKQVEVSEQMYAKFSGVPIVGIAHAQALLDIKRNKACLKVLSEVNVLPAEFANSGHSIYELANLHLAVESLERKEYDEAIIYLNDAKKWPENLGSGKPYEPDNTLLDYMLAHCERQLGHTDAAEEYYHKIFEYAARHRSSGGKLCNNYIVVSLLQDKGKVAEARSYIDVWEKEQTEINNWGIGSGIASPKVQWVLAKSRNELEIAKRLEAQILQGAPVGQLSILLRAIAKIDGK